NLRTGAAVALGRPAGARARPLSQTLVVDLQQPVGRQAVQVELDPMVRQPGGRRGLIAPHRLVPAADVAVELASHRLGERADARDSPVEVSIRHLLLLLDEPTP